MIRRIRLIRNIGTFDSATMPADLALNRLALLYAENGRGKTTIAAILRSLQSGESAPIEERRRLGAAHPPHAVIELDTLPMLVYEQSRWSHTLPNVIIYDDVFVDDNIYSGLSVDADHRQNLNEVILGSAGVALNKSLQQYVHQIETHNRDLRLKADAIPPSTRGTLSVEAFCGLPHHPDVDADLIEARRALSAVSEAASVQRAAMLSHINIPAFNTSTIQTLGQRQLLSFDEFAAARVKTQLVALGDGAESWIAEGVRFLESALPNSEHGCPFCTQDTRTVPIVDYYRAYFSKDYSDLMTAIASELDALSSAHSTASVSNVSTAINTNEQAWHYWSRFAELPSITINLDQLLFSWSEAATRLRQYLDTKHAFPLTQHPVPDDLLNAITKFDVTRREVDAINRSIDDINRSIALVKESSAAGSISAIEADIRRLNTVRSRQTDDVNVLCNSYLAEQAAKTRTEAERDRAKLALDTYRNAVFPTYEAAINAYLLKLTAGFRIDSVTSTSTRGGASCTYNVLVNNIPVPVTSMPGTGQPSFRNVLSAGDRNTLALAFFFASLDQVNALPEQIIIFDDPMTSLDEHRLLATAQQLRRLSQNAAQVIILSHDKPFLFRIWDGADNGTCSALKIDRSADGSTLIPWDVTAATITEHDKRHAALRAYILTNRGDPRQIATSLRIMLETYLRVTYPDGFGPGTLLGHFIQQCRVALATPGKLLDAADIEELEDLKEYANRFHHDSNAAAGATIINDAELAAFARRVHTFMGRS